MDSIKEMSKEIFRNNLMMSISELMGSEDINEDSIRILITPVYENGKSLTAQDNIMRLILLSDENIKDKKLTVQQTVDLLAGFQPLVPLWIDVSVKQINKDETIILLETSVRCRKPSLLRNVESGHPPFRSKF